MGEKWFIEHACAEIEPDVRLASHEMVEGLLCVGAGCVLNEEYLLVD